MCTVRSTRGEFRRRGCWHLCRAAIFLFSIASVARPESTRVSTRFGAVRGLWSRSSRGRLAAHYLGVPYAEPPLGDLRFRSPQPWHRTWNDTYYAIENTAKCIQLNSNGDIEGDEDCLHLNIYVPLVSEEWDSNTRLPVMVYVHGGKLASGDIDSRYYAPDYLMDHDLILVTVNYRLNVFGFFSTDNKISPGNYGLKDVLMALKWVHQNIKSFHGDPNSVTLWGHSSGAALVHALALSKKTEGLFDKYIMQSGTLFGNSFKNSNYQMRSVSLEVAKLLRCLPYRMENDTETVTDSVVSENYTMQPEKITVRDSREVVEEDYSEEEEEEMMRCMRSLDAKKIVKVVKHLNVWRGNPCCTFGLTIEDESEDAIFTMHPLTIIKNGLLRDIPFITGVVEKEGLVKTAAILVNPESQSELKNNTEEYLPLLLDCDNQITNVSEFISTLEDFYFDGNITENLLENLTRMVTDGVITWPQYRTLNYHSEATVSNNYFYLFSYEGTFSDTFKFGTMLHYGVSHGDELNYLFPLLNRKYKDEMLHNTESDVTMINIMTEMWASFATNGVPEAWSVLAWPSYRNSREYLRFGMGKNPDVTVENDFLPERMAFWEELTRNLIIEDTEPDSMVEVENQSGVNGSNEYDISLFFTLTTFIICLL